jgi:hypothetical protein
MAMPMNRIVLLLLFVPAFLVFAPIADDYLPREWFGGNPQSGAWGLAGAVTGSVYLIMMRKIKSLRFTEPLEIKVYNEQIKLLAATTNAIAIGLLAVALIEPIKGNLEIYPMTAIWLVLAVIAHSFAQKLLSFMQNDRT